MYKVILEMKIVTSQSIQNQLTVLKRLNIQNLFETWESTVYWSFHPAKVNNYNNSSSIN